MRHARGQRRALPRPADRRGAGHQPGVDPEAAPRQEACAATRTEAVTDTILRRMPDYVNYIVPAVRAHARELPARADGGHLATRSSRATSRRADESMVVIRFANPKGIDFPYLLSMMQRLVDVARRTPSSCPAARWSWRCS
ncbi:MAG: hypothetical protein MZW92_57670 [Comamonadaceae bacterium]|nr:hypothetical protein [Comamonadaceae bacterium]